MRYLPSSTYHSPQKNYAHSLMPTGVPKTQQLPTHQTHKDTLISSSHDSCWGTFYGYIDPYTGSQNTSPFLTEAPLRQRSKQQTNVLWSCITSPTTHKKWIWKKHLCQHPLKYTMTTKRVSTGPTVWQKKGSGACKYDRTQSVNPCKETLHVSRMYQDM